MATSYATPGVYINEINAFPNSVVPVATAVPAFIGYTARASYKGQSYTNVPVEITSFQEFMIYFGQLASASEVGLTYAPENEQYSPIYYVTPSKVAATSDITIAGKAYDVEPDPNTVYYLYNSIKLFYANGGGSCWVVSVGPYGPPKGSPKAKADPLINANVVGADLMGALALLEQEPDPTMIVIPDATLLKAADNSALIQAVLLHCDKMQSRVGLFDILKGNDPDPVQWTTDIINFRTATGINALKFGIAYYPFLETAIVEDGGINFDNLGGAKGLSAILPTASLDPIKTLLANIDKPAGPTTPTGIQIENALLNTSDTYSQLHDLVLEKINILPPSAAMAGVYTLVDNEKGVWHAPANVSLSSVTDTTLRITDGMQANLNVDAATGKSINAIRLFPGKGVIVWGARTLDGNSDDWRYINVKRTLIMIEQSMKLAANDYVFAPNDANTWSLVESMLNNFLTNLWKQGALVGSTPGEAFSVSIGLGLTMTSEDILQGLMNVTVKVAVSHPAEFIVITIQQQMQTS